jgi:hypothetical protein
METNTNNEVAYSPLRISLILHCYSRADWIEHEKAPAVQEELKSLVSSGILEPKDMPPHYKLTPRGLKFVKTLLATPFPAPEESHAINKNINTAFNKNMNADKCPNKGTRRWDEEPAPEWRELGPEEEIHTGDQVQAKHHDRVHGVWYDVFPYEVGAMPIDHEAMRYRTRRPLHNSLGFGGIKKQEEMPLDDEIETLWEHSEHIDSLTGHMAFKALAKSIRYLRDEIQKLKEAK